MNSVMSSQRYERVRIIWASTFLLQFLTRSKTDNQCMQVSASDENDHLESPRSPSDRNPTPSSPPPSFRSRTSSPSSRRLLHSEDPITSDAERTLADTFDDGSDSDEDADNNGDDRQRLMRATTAQSVTYTSVNDEDNPAIPQPPNASLPVVANVPARPYTRAAPFSSLSQSNDGVFANLNAKPERGEKTEEQPPVRPFQTKPSTFATILTSLVNSPTKLPQPTQLHPTGKQQS